MKCLGVIPCMITGKPYLKYCLIMTMVSGFENSYLEYWKASIVGKGGIKYTVYRKIVKEQISFQIIGWVQMSARLFLWQFGHSLLQNTLL